MPEMKNLKKTCETGHYYSSSQKKDKTYLHPDKVVYNDDDGTITETWKLNDMTQEEHVYTLSFENKGTADEQVTAITFPDGSIMTLEGF